MLADIREIFDQTQQIEGVHTVNIYENVTPRPNRHDLMIEMEMDPEALPVYDASAAHQEWKANTGTIFSPRLSLIMNKIVTLNALRGNSYSLFRKFR